VTRSRIRRELQVIAWELSSIIRPAAHRFADDFIRRAHGQPYRALHPTLHDALSETFGIMVYQEDVMKVAVALGGFSIEDGDQLRKILSKKHKQRQLRDYQQQFCAGALARGAELRAIEQIWAMIISLRLQFLQTSFGQLRAGVFQIGLSSRPLPG